MGDLDSRVARLEHAVSDALYEIKDAVVEIRELVRKTDKFESKFESVQDHEHRLRKLESAFYKWAGGLAVISFVVPLAVKLIGN